MQILQIGLNPQIFGDFAVFAKKKDTSRLRKNGPAHITFGNALQRGPSDRYTCRSDSSLWATIVIPQSHPNPNFSPSAKPAASDYGRSTEPFPMMSSLAAWGGRGGGCSGYRDTRRPCEEADPVEAQQRRSDAARMQASYSWTHRGRAVETRRCAPLHADVGRGSGSSATHDEEEEYPSESSLTTWEVSSDEDDPISSSDYAAPEQEEEVMQQMQRRSRRHAHNLVGEAGRAPAPGCLLPGRPAPRAAGGARGRRRLRQHRRRGVGLW
jgi:hypothetical protein